MIPDDERAGLSQRVQGLAASSAERAKDSSEILHNYKELTFCKKPIKCCFVVLTLTARFLKEDRLGLAPPIIRTAVSGLPILQPDMDGIQMISKA